MSFGFQTQIALVLVAARTPQIRGRPHQSTHPARLTLLSVYEYERYPCVLMGTSV